MEKIALITDTTSDLPETIRREYDVKVLPFRIIYKDREYKDQVEISAQEVYSNLNKEVPTSSLPSMKEMEELYEQLDKEGYTHAIGITLSSGLSGIHNALKLVSEQFQNIRSFIYDSKSISLGEGVLVEKCGQLIRQGLSFESIVSALPQLRKNVHLFFIVGTLEYLKRGGRIGKISGTIGELLNIKPIVSVDEEGKYFTCEKIRGRKKSLNRMIEIAAEFLERKASDIYILHGDAEDEAKELVQKMSVLKNANNVEFTGAISPVSGVHSGPGLVGVIIVER